MKRIRAIRRLYRKRLWSKMVTDYPDWYYAVMTLLGALIGIIIMGFVLF